MTAALLVLAAGAASASVSVKEEVPFRLDSGLTKAEYFIARQKYAEALSESQAVIRRHGPQADAYTYLGLSFQRLGDNKQAAENYARALALAPTHLGANGYMALLHIENGDMPKAIEQMQVLRAVCGASGCEELIAVESAINAARKGAAPAKTAPKALPVRGETPRNVE
jgi:tetratricopeptide (TPR) repeat protein